MMYCFGINFQSADLALREQLAPSRAMQQQWLKSLRAAGVEEAVVLVTCNRTEIYACGTDATVATHVDSLLQQHCGTHWEAIHSASYRVWNRDVIAHLFRVIASLDSMVLGEPQIVGQVKQAFEQSKALALVGKTLHQVFTRAFHTGKRVRSETGIAERPVSVSSVAVRLAAQLCGAMEGVRVVVLGAGDIGEATVRSFADAGVQTLTLVNRTVEKAQRIADGVGCEVCTWEERASVLQAADVVVCSVAGSEPVLHKDDVAAYMDVRKRGAFFIVDLGVPRNVDILAAELDDVYLYNIDDLHAVAEQNKAARESDVTSAERIVHEATVQLWSRMQQTGTAHTIASLHRKCEQIRQAEVAKSVQRLAQPGVNHEEVLESCTRAIVTKILHDPTMQIRPPAMPDTQCRMHEEVAHNWLKRLFRLD